MGLVPVVLAVFVVAFSLGNQPGALSTTLAPDAYSGANAYATMTTLANAFPHRPAGSRADRGIAAYMSKQLSTYGFAVTANSFRGVTPSGPRTLENVVGIRAGQQNGSIVVAAPRDATGSPASAELSGTAVLVELARVLSGETLQHTVVLASTTGTAGAAGAIALARTLPQPVEGVIVLGDLAGTTAREPIVVPWSNGQRVAPPLLRNTVGAALQSQAGLNPGGTSLLGQLAHLVLPMAPSGQAPLDSSGEPAVLLSLSDEQLPSAREQTSPGQINALGRTVLQAINALDSGTTAGSPSAYLTFSGKTVPAWAIRLLALFLVLPVLLAAIDGLARARRRGHLILRWIAWVLAGAVPFVLSALIIRAGEAVGAIGGATPLPLESELISVHPGGLALIGVLACLIVGGLVWMRPWLAGRLGLRRTGEDRSAYGDGAAAGVLLVLCLLALALWWANPFAALLVVPALHLWMWVVVPDVRLPRPAVLVLVLAGLALPALVATQYATSLGLGPIEAVWSWVLLIGGGGFGLFSAVEWSLFLGCAASVIAIAARAARQPRSEPAPVSIRGPITYAGPGSLGGTKSALRRQ